MSGDKHLSCRLFRRGEEGSIASFLVRHLLGFLLFLVFLAGLNIFDSAFQNYHLHMVTTFLNGQVLLILAVFVLFLAGELFFALILPFSLIGPLLHAFGSLFLLEFLFNAIEFLGMLAQLDLRTPVRIVGPVAYALIFLLVLVTGVYRALAIHLSGPGERSAEKGTSGAPEGAAPGAEERPAGEKKVHDWEDIGGEFREFLYDLLNYMRRSLK